MIRFYTEYQRYPTAKPQFWSINLGGLLSSATSSTRSPPVSQDGVLKFRISTITGHGCDGDPNLSLPSHPNPGDQSQLMFCTGYGGGDELSTTQLDGVDATTCLHPSLVGRCGHKYLEHRLQSAHYALRRRPSNLLETSTAHVQGLFRVQRHSHHLGADIREKRLCRLLLAWRSDHLCLRFLFLEQCLGDYRKPVGNQGVPEC